MAGLSVTESIKQRKSVREFQDKAVPRALLEEILQLALLSSSGSNLQPWKIHLVSGEAKEQLTQTVNERIMELPMGEGGDIPIYPEKLQEPWRQRRGVCGEVVYEALGIARDDKMARMMQVLKNFSFFGAPVGLIITMDRSLSKAQIVDIGLILQNIQLLAVERGLDTCAQASWTMWPKTVREVLGLEESEMVMVGMALGYADTQAPVNHAKQSRVGLEEAVSFHGFG
ncbi:MAG: nitroreductase [Cellvibrionaceae bacterium]